MTRRCLDDAANSLVCVDAEGGDLMKKRLELVRTTVKVLSVRTRLQTGGVAAPNPPTMNGQALEVIVDTLLLSAPVLPKQQ